MTRGAAELDWALNRRGERIHSATSSGGVDLFCPVCSEPVRLKRGVVYRSHFAHLSGTKRIDCELYTPGTHTGAAGKRVVFHWSDSGTESWAQPALVWDASKPTTSSLLLRVPAHGSVDVHLVSRRGTSRIPATSGVRPSFVHVSLARPPADVRTTPFSPTTEAAIRECLSRFDLTGNYFLASATGGVLLARDAPLEEESVYWLVTQAPPVQPPPDGVTIISTVKERSWTVLQVRISRRDADYYGAEARERYLARRVLPARPDHKLLWPRPFWVETDGTLAVPASSRRLIVRSSTGVPVVVSASGDAERCARWVANDLYEITIASNEPLLEIRSNVARPIRVFAAASDNVPPSVWVSSPLGRARLEDQRNAEAVASEFPVDIELPYQALQRSLRSYSQRDFAQGAMRIEDAVVCISCGGFGVVRCAPQTPIAQEALPIDWYASLPAWLTAGFPRTAQLDLRRATSVRDVYGWAAKHSKDEYLTVLLTAFRRMKRRALS